MDYEAFLEHAFHDPTLGAHTQTQAHGFGWAWVRYYCSYKVTSLEKNEIIAAVSLALSMNRDTTAKFSMLYA